MAFKTKSGVEITGEYINTLYNSCKQWRDPYKSDWITFYKQYRSYRDEMEYPLRSSIFVPYTFALIETVVPLMLGALFNTEPMVSVTARKGAIYELASIIEEGLAYFVEDYRVNIYFKLEDFLKDCAIYGTSFARILPQFKKDNEYNVNNRKIAKYWRTFILSDFFIFFKISIGNL